jgi:riboflavin kinase / FMN adenylyltransferase
LKKYFDPVELINVRNPVVTVGTFDGVHLGHRSILDRLCELATTTPGETVLVTFEPHPRIALKKEHENLKLLTTPEEKAELLEAAGIDHLVIFSFTEAFSKLKEHEFIRTYLVEKMHVSVVVVGYDHRFGFKRQGNYNSLSEFAHKFNFRVEEMPEKDIGCCAVSSTQIRNELTLGNILNANEMLGYQYFISGKVVEGDKQGRKLGFPTANIRLLNPYKQIPAHGVYAVKVKLDEKIYNGMCNIGTRPTFDGKDETIEVNIFDLDADLYGKDIRMYFIDRLRAEKKFTDKNDLQQQIQKDRKQALNILQKNDENS